MRRFNDQDYQTLCKWMSQYGMGECPKSALPQVGYIIDNKACGFLYQTDSDMCYLDLIVANKEVQHNDELDEIVEALCDYATKQGYRIIIGLTRHKVVIDRAVRHRFKISDEHRVVFKQLNT